MCIYGHGVVRGIFEELDNHNLKGFEIWLPMMSGDDVEAADSAGGTFRDARVSHLWDLDRQLGTLLAKSLNLRETSWDIYTLYDRGIRWEGEILPRPSLWMAQLPSESGIDEASFLDPGKFVGKLNSLLRNKSQRNLLDSKLHFHARGILEVIQKGEESRRFIEEIGIP